MVYDLGFCHEQTGGKVIYAIDMLLVLVSHNDKYPSPNHNSEVEKGKKSRLSLALELWQTGTPIF